ncbi:MAG: FumA C-terminus/TtdB family hydratase beta subunit [Candidatus Omnitrophota bacterium]|nr:FumA C-terminus/TtdB family hydratase beta subunit [Candidatus Omnitrophota bacterium]
MIKIYTPLNKKSVQRLKAGDEVLLSGIIYTARDQAHKRLVRDKGIGKGRGRDKGLPFNIENAVIYYCGPTKTPPGKIIGSCGPTTSRRMDEFTPQLLKLGLKGMIGKGDRSPGVCAAIKKYKAVHFLTFAGCAAFLNKYIKKARVIAYKDLGPGAIYELEVKDLPLFVGIDCRGRSIYKTKK